MIFPVFGGCQFLLPSILYKCTLLGYFANFPEEWTRLVRPVCQGGAAAMLIRVAIERPRLQGQNMKTTAVDPESPDLLESLREGIRRIETAGRCDAGRVFSTGCEELDRELPGGGLAAGTIAEWLTPPGGYGARILSLLAARSACADGGALVVMDAERVFFPPAAVAWGMDLSGMVVIRPRSGDRSDLCWAIDQALRSPAVGAVWGVLPDVGERWQRRFQLSAESSGAMGLFVRPLQVLGQPGWSEVQWRIEEAAAGVRQTGEGSGECGRRSFDREIHLRLVRVRGGTSGSRTTVRIDFTTGQVRGVEGADRWRVPGSRKVRA
jgi:protein ImuA